MARDSRFVERRDLSKTWFWMGIAPALLFAAVGSARAQDEVRFAPGRLWTGSIAAGGRIPLAGDVDGDGRADLIMAGPSGAAGVQVYLGSTLGKPRQARGVSARFDTDVAAAACGHFVERDRCDLIVLLASGDVRLLSSYRASEDRFAVNISIARLPATVATKPPITALTVDGGGSAKADAALLDAAGKITLLHNETGPDGAPRFTIRPVEGALPRFRRIAAGAFAPGRPALVWLDAGGGLFRADLRVDRDRPVRLGPAVRLWTVASGDGLAVGRFTGAASCDIVAGRSLLVAGSAERILREADLPGSDEAREDSLWLAADLDGDGRDDILRVRRSSARFVGEDVLVHLAGVGAGPAWNACAMNDGLFDAWKTGKARPGGLDLAALGCAVGHRDIIVEVQRIEDVPEETVRKQVARVVKYFAGLPIENPDGRTGIAMHVLYREPVPIAEKDVPWTVLAAKYHAPALRGVTHWMLVYNGGGGQTGEMSDQGSCGVTALYATFLHEMGHQLGLDHTGHWGPSWCPTYPSVMNYAYNYQLNGSADEIGYSDGRLASVILNEKHLSEHLPLPMDRIAFLAGPPYNYRLQPSEDARTTLIDWNRNGRFGEPDVAADINYGYATQAGPQHLLGKSLTAPALAVLEGAAGGGRAAGQESRLAALYGRLAAAPAGAGQSVAGLSREQPGSLQLRVWSGTDPQRDGDRWEPEREVEAAGVCGDPSAATLDGAVWAAYPVRAEPHGGAEGAFGVALRRIALDDAGRVTVGPRTLVPTTPGAQASLAAVGHRLVLLLWRGATIPMAYRVLTIEGDRVSPQPERTLEFTSIAPVGAAAEGDAALWIGLAQDFPGGMAARWQVRRFAVSAAGALAETKSEWVGGVDGTERGTGRLVLLHEENPAFGPGGQLYVLGCGPYSDKGPWDCHYVAMRIGDKEAHGGWLTRRYYDEWTQSRSAPGACLFRGDIAFAARFAADGSSLADNSNTFTDNDLFAGFFGKGIESAPMGDFDDIGFIRDIGLSHSLVWAGE